jgi:hypothetical protein
VNYSFAVLVCTAVQPLCQSPGTAAIAATVLAVFWILVVFLSSVAIRAPGRSAGEPELLRAMFDVGYPAEHAAGRDRSSL